MNTANTLDELIAQTQHFAAELTNPVANQRLMLYMLRQTAAQAMLMIDHARYEVYKAEQQLNVPIEYTYHGAVREPSFTVDDL